MVARQVISSEFFASRSKISPRLMRSLLIRGRGVQVEDCLRRFGWDGLGAVVTPILTVNPESGMVIGARFDTRGKGPEVKFRASELWGEVEEDAVVTLKFPDLSKIIWRGDGEFRNQSEWLDSDDVEVSYSKVNGESLSVAEEATIGKFAVRFTVLPMAVDKMVLYGGIVPVDKVALREKAMEGGLDLDSPLIPTVALKLWWFKGTLRNGYPSLLLPSEGRDDKVGLGVLPLIESIGAMDPMLPEHDDLEKQLCLLMCKVTGTNNVNIQRWANLTSEGNFPPSVTGVIQFSWPEYRGPLSQGGSRNASGLCLYDIYVFEIHIRPTQLK